MGQTLRPYQVRAVDALRASIARGHKRILLVAPTGSGKTTISSAIIAGAVAKNSPVLFLAHRRELIDQCVARLAEHDVAAGIIMAGRRASKTLVQVGSIQTLARRAVPAARIIVVDEAHHGRAKSYERPIAANPGAIVIGLTATPWRTDGRGLGSLFEDLVVAARPAELIADGFLVPVEGFVYDAPELRGVRTVGGDYDEDQAAEAMTYLGGNIMQRWLDVRPGRTVLFACTVQHSRDLAAAFVAAGVAAEHLDGTTPLEERAAILARLADGTTELVTNVGVLCEGWDLPSLRCVILARPTKSPGLYIQQAGRGLRPSPGKTVARIHDHAGNTLRHGLVDEDRDYSLAGDTKRTEKSTPTKTCPKCYAIFRPAPRCPSCGFEFPKAATGVDLPKHVQGEEVSFADMQRRLFVSSREAHPAYNALAETGRQRDYKPGWAKFRFKQRFGFWPKKAWTAPYDTAYAATHDPPDPRLAAAGDYETTERPCGAPSDD